jgi:hypothetical protein
MIFYINIIHLNYSYIFMIFIIYCILIKWFCVIVDYGFCVGFTAYIEIEYLILLALNYVFLMHRRLLGSPEAQR